MGIKEAALQLGVEIENQVIQARADQIEMGQQLTERINGVANQVKQLDGKVEMLKTDVNDLKTDVNDLKTGFGEMKSTQAAMMHILIDVQRKLNAN
ncbi:hypothetical protein [Nonomuraea rhizosphaerae]|uniref:hypothetical protein n=1 Tax=Nonomuraea rhizosphaerae TaxID=2665663 RepID=UPI001C5E413D|nr:hypothetical protein [Nonomuraea rhizosphaerae]